MSLWIEYKVPKYYVVLFWYWSYDRNSNLFNLSSTVHSGNKDA